MKTSKRTIAIFLGALLSISVATVVVLCFASFGQIDAVINTRKHTAEMISGVESLLASVSQAETDQRGYSLTGDEIFLEPYAQASIDAADRLAKLGEGIAIVEARASLNALAPLIASKFAEMESVVALRRKGDMAAVIAAVSDGRGRRLMDSIRAEGASLMRIEEEALARNEGEFTGGSARSSSL